MNAQVNVHMFYLYPGSITVTPFRSTTGHFRDILIFYFPIAHKVKYHFFSLDLFLNSNEQL